MKNTRLYGIRGAVCTKNTADDIKNAVSMLMKTLFFKNNLTDNENDIVSIHFTQTEDLTAFNPAAALRKAGLGTKTALFCSLEPRIEHALPTTIRVLVTAYLPTEPQHVYINGAEVLRPDFSA